MPTTKNVLNIVSPECQERLKFEDKAKNRVKTFNVPTTKPRMITYLDCYLKSLIPVGRDGLLYKPGQKQIIKVSRSQLDRALRILHILFLAFEERNLFFDISNDPTRALCPFVEVLDTSIYFRIKEACEKDLYTGLYVPTGRLYIQIFGPNEFNYRAIWHDTQIRRLESQLNSFIKGLYIHAEGVKAHEKRLTEIQNRAEKRFDAVLSKLPLHL